MTAEGGCLIMVTRCRTMWLSYEFSTYQIDSNRDRLAPAPDMFIDGSCITQSVTHVASINRGLGRDFSRNTRITCVTTAHDGPSWGSLAKIGVFDRMHDLTRELFQPKRPDKAMKDQPRDAKSSSDASSCYPRKTCTPLSDCTYPGKPRLSSLYRDHKR